VREVKVKVELKTRAEVAVEVEAEKEKEIEERIKNLKSKESERVIHERRERYFETYKKFVRVL